ncbi:hypothetical protein ACN08Z_07045 [Rothia sp. P7181]|uniref:hypothetical protein n=1 Tax=unclassified Rothia (in: high G+C Gram-positive bacteria) TaxID=2689056 RepID=UPI003AD55434
MSKKFITCAALTGLLALSACGAQNSTASSAASSSTPSSTPSATPSATATPTPSATPSVTPTPSEKPTPTPTVVEEKPAEPETTEPAQEETPEGPTPEELAYEQAKKDAEAAGFQAINAIIEDMYSQGLAGSAAAKKNLADKVSTALSNDIKSRANAKTPYRELLEHTPEEKLIPILEDVKNTAPYASRVDTTGMNTADQLALFMLLADVSNGVNDSNYRYYDFQAADNTEVDFNGDNKVTLSNITSKANDVNARFVDMSNPEENYNFSLIRTDQGWQLEGPVMLDYFTEQIHR